MRLSQSPPVFLTVIAFAACSDSSKQSLDPVPPLDTVVGHFIGPAWTPIEPAGYYLAISLTRAGGNQLTGIGWIAGLSYPAIPLHVSGTYATSNLDLTLTATDGSPFASLTGSANQVGLTGEWTRGSASLPIQLTRIDTNATATYQATLAGAFSLEQQGAAGFTFRPSSNQTTLWLGWPSSDYPLFAVEWTGATLATGTYDLALSPAFKNAAVYPTGTFELRFNVVSGTLTLELSTEYAMIGHVLVQAQEEGATSMLTFDARFSAGCAGLPCRP